MSTSVGLIAIERRMCNGFTFSSHPMRTIPIPCNWRPAPKSRILCLSRRGRHDNRVPSRQKSSQCYTKASRAARFRAHCPWFDRADFQGRETAIINGGRGQQGTACRETTLAILKRLARAVGVPVTELLDGRLEGLST